MFHASNLEVRERWYTASGLCDRVCVRPCVHAFALQTVNINTDYLMKFNMRSPMKNNMRKHYESEGEG